MAKPYPLQLTAKCVVTVLLLISILLDKRRLKNWTVSHNIIGKCFEKQLSQEVIKFLPETWCHEIELKVKSFPKKTYPLRLKWCDSTFSKLLIKNSSTLQILYVVSNQFQLLHCNWSFFFKWKLCRNLEDRKLCTCRLNILTYMTIEPPGPTVIGDH